MDEILLDKIRGCLMGAMIGDAMGMPWEALSREAILDLTNGKGVQGFEDPGVRKIKDSEKATLGDTTDDWFLTKTVAESLIACKGFDINHQALRHVKALETSTFGCGKTTKNSIKEIKDYFDSRGEVGRNPAIKAVNDGAGNGVAMKIAPLACFNSVLSTSRKRYIGDETFIDNIYDLGYMTHQNVDASYSAVVVAVYIFKNLTNYSLHPIIPINSKVHEKLSLALTLKSTDSLVRKIGCGFVCWESVPFSIAMAMNHMNDFKAGMLATLSAGGDADSNAGMVGALIGSNVGLSGIPKEWKEFRPEYKEAIELADKLYVSWNTIQKHIGI